MFCVCFCLFLFVFSFAVKADNSIKTIEIHDENEVRLIGNKVAVLEDVNNSFLFKDVLNSENFELSQTAVSNFGVTSSAYWFKFKVKNATTAQQLLLEIEFPEIDEVEFYSPEPNGEYKLHKSGQNIPFSQREYDHQHYIFQLNVKPNKSKVFFLKVRSGEDLLVPLSVGTERAIFQMNTERDLISGIYFGIVLIMLLYNLFVYFSVKDKSYLLYVGYILFVGLVQACFLGYGFKYLWPNSTWIALKSVYIAGAGSGIFVLLFLSRFLQVKRYFPRLYKVSFVLHFIYALSLILAFLNFSNLAFNILNANAMLVSIYVFVVCIKILLLGSRTAKFFLWAWSIFFLGVILFVMRNFGLLPYNDFTYYILMIGSGIGILVLSLALADKINIYKDLKDKAQERVLKQLKAKKKLMEEQNVMLEEKVAERTKALHFANVQLSKKNDEKVAMMKEIHHRVKNNLQVVNSLLRLQSYEVQDERVVKLFEECQNRVLSMALLHEKMYNSEDLKSINVKDHFTLLAEDLLRTYEVENEVELDLKIENVDLGMDTLVPLGLIINEMITNALKHAFKNERKGVISIYLSHVNEKNFKLIIGDDGVGVDQNKQDNKDSTLGTELIHVFTEQLEGTIEKLDRPGAFFKILFKKIGNT